MDEDTFTLLPLHMDPSSKSLSLTSSSSLPPTSSSAITASLANINNIHRTLLTLPRSQTNPLPPLPTNPKRSAQIQKMREQGNAALSKGTNGATEAIKLYTYALDMALQRPGWEPAGLVREECAILYANRAQAYMSAGLWAEGSVDAKTSVDLKRQGNGKAWWRGGKCLVEMGRWRDAQGWVREGLEMESEKGGELGVLAREIDARLNPSS